MKKFSAIMFWVCIVACIADTLAASICLGVPALRGSVSSFALGAAVFFLAAVMHRKISEG